MTDQLRQQIAGVRRALTRMEHRLDQLESLDYWAESLAAEALGAMQNKVSKITRKELTGKYKPVSPERAEPPGEE